MKRTIQELREWQQKEWGRAEWEFYNTLIHSVGGRQLSMASTLCDEGYSSIREMILRGDLDTKGLYVFPKKSEHAYKATQVFNLVTKELLAHDMNRMHLMQQVPLVRLYEAFEKDDYETVDSFRTTHYLLIEDFRDSADPFWLDSYPAIKQKIANLIAGRLYSPTLHTSFLATHELLYKKYSAGWEPKLLNLIAERTVTIGVS